jgi:hypothetical protein
MERSMDYYDAEGRRHRKKAAPDYPHDGIFHQGTTDAESKAR